MRKVLLSAFLATVMLGGQSYGEIPAPSLMWDGFASLRLGDIVKGEPETIIGKNAKSDSVWVQEMIVGLSLQTNFKNIPATGTIGIEMDVCNDNSAAANDLGTTRRLNFYPYLSRADLLFNILDRENSKLELDVGYFPYKYNSCVRNLGEYLFRSGTYPQYLINEIDFPMARLMGLRFGGNFWKTFNFDVLLTANTEWTAIGDLNLSALISYKPTPLIELGVGGSWCSIVSVDLNKTTPLDSFTQYLAVAPGTNDTATYNYTFAGQKVMGRFTLDLKQLFGGIKDIFGEEDLKLYSEAAVLGLIDYPASVQGFKGADSLWHPFTEYNNIWQRIPVMVGFNVPTFKLLDVLSAEVEYFGNPYPNDLNPIVFDNQPVPLSSFGGERSANYMNLHGDDWKWSVYLKRTFAGCISVMGQAARDHIRWYRLDYTKEDGKEALRKNKDWYWTFKLGYAF